MVFHGALAIGLLVFLSGGQQLRPGHEMALFASTLLHSNPPLPSSPPKDQHFTAVDIILFPVVLCPRY